MKKLLIFSLTVLISITLVCSLSSCEMLNSLLGRLEFTSHGDGTCSVTGIGGCKDSNIAIPATSPRGDVVKRIGLQAFEDCDNIENIVIPNSVTCIDDSAFSSCTNLKSVVIGDGVTSIGYYAFRGCTSLESIVMGDGVTSIGGHAFLDCTSLKSIEIPASVKSMDEAAFSYCTSLTSLYIEDVAKWCSFSFEHYYNNPLYYAHNLYLNGELVTDLVIPDGVTSIGRYAFLGCTSLKSIEIPDSVTSIDKYAFEDCTSLVYNEYDNAYYLGNENNPYVALVMAKDENVTSCVMHNSTKVISGGAFSDCMSLESIEIPDSVTGIGGYAFEGCTSLMSIEIPDGVTSIGSYAFQDCASLSSIDIGDNVTDINLSAFHGCTSLVYNEYDNAYYLGNENNPYVALVMAKDENVTSCVMHNSTKVIADSAFSDCMSLESIEIPDSVTSIGVGAFRNCTDLTEINFNAVAMNDLSSDSRIFYNAGTNSRGITVNFGANVTKIPAYLFYINNSISDSSYSPKIVKVNFAEDSVFMSIGDRAFSSCTSLKSVEIPDSVTSIGYDAFYNCTSLESVVIGEGVTSLGVGAFRDCTDLTEINFNSVAMNDLSSDSRIFYNAGTNSSGITVNFGANVTKIPAYLFHLNYLNLSKVVKVNFEHGSVCTNIGESAFHNCDGLTSITIPDSVISIGGYAFYNCTSLENVYYKGTAWKWEKITIGSYNYRLYYATRYYYFEREPAASGKYWHYDADGEPVVWN